MELIKVPMTHKELLTLPIELQRKIIERQVAELQSLKTGALCITCSEIINCKMRDAVQYCGGFKRKKEGK